MKHNWEYKRLGDVATYVNGYAFKPSDWLEIGYPIIRIQNLNNEDAEYNYSDGNIPAKYFVANGDLLISWSASLGAYIWHGDRAVLNQHIFKVVFDKTDILKRYLKYFVDFSLPLMATKTHGATMKHITKPRFDALPIPVPPMEVQERIVAELDKINETIEDCRELLRNLDALAQSLFYDFFGDPITNPKGWEMKHFKEILYKIGSGATPKGGKQSYQGGNISLIRSLNVYNTYFKYDDLAKINANQAYELRNVEVQFDDVLLNITGASVARCFIVPKDTLPARVNQHVAILRPNNKFIRPKFLHRLIITPSFQNFLIGTARGKSATREALPKATLEMIKIPVPPISLQEQFAARIEQIEEQKKAVELTIAELQTLLDSRMDYWFN